MQSQQLAVTAHTSGTPQCRGVDLALHEKGQPTTPVLQVVGYYSRVGGQTDVYHNLGQPDETLHELEHQGRDRRLYSA